MPGPRPCHCRPFIFCIVGRGLDRLTAHNERRQPAKLARSCGCLPCRGKHCSLPDFAPLNRGPTLTTPHLRGASGTPPPTTQSAGLLITANVRGGLGAGRPTSHFTTFRGADLRPQLIHATLPLPPRILCIVGRQATGPLHKKPCPFKHKNNLPATSRRQVIFLVPFLLRKGTNPRLVKITSGQSPQPRRPAPAGPAGSARPSCR